MPHGNRRVHSLTILLFLLAPLLFPCTPSVNQGFPGNFFSGVRIIERPLPGWTVRFEPAGQLIVSNIRYDVQGYLLFDLQVSPTAPPGFYTSFCEYPGDPTITNNMAFQVLAAQTPTPIPPTATPQPTATPTQPPPTATSTPPAATATPTPTATSPGATPTPTRTFTPPGPTPTGPPGRLRIAPNSIASGSLSNRLVIGGDNFDRSTRVTTPADVLLETVQLLSPMRLEIVVSTRPGTPSGPRVIAVDTPGIPTRTVVITVVPPESLSAPVSVTTASIVSPRPGTFVAPGERIFAKGLLATTGTGPIVGVWLFDDVPFDRFDVHATGGAPIEIESKAPIPISTDGDHFLRLVVERPQIVSSDPVRIVKVARTAASPRLIEPAAGAEVRAPVLFRWTLVPGAQAYEIVFSPVPEIRADAGLVRVVGGSARLTEEELKKANKIPLLSDIPVIKSFWSVRPIHPVDVPGQPAPPQELTIFLTPRVLRPPEGSEALVLPDGARISWKPVARGVVYRVTFFSPRAPARPLFAALTSRTEYRLLRGLLPEGTERLLFRVEALGPGGMSLGESALRPMVLARGSPPGRLQPAALDVVVSSVAPAGGEPRPSRHPTIAAAWEGRLPPDSIALVMDGVDVTPVARIGEGKIAYTSLLPLPPGTHEAVVRLGDAVTAWSFQTREPTRPPPATAAAAGSSGYEAEGDWQVDLSGFVSVLSGSGPAERDTLHGTLSSTSSFLGDTWSIEETVELAAHHELDSPRETVQDSRNWLLRAGGGGKRWRADGIVGYAAPESADGLEILATGFTRGGVEVKLTTPAGRFSSYGTFDDELKGIFSSTLGEEQRIRFGAWEAPLPSDRFLLRAVYLDVRDEGNPADLVSPTKATAYGGIGRWTVSPAFAVTLEGARSKLEPSDDPERSGNSFRLNLGGIVSATRWVVNLFRTDGRFLNPANPSLTDGVQPDRTGGDFGLSRIFGKLTAGIGYRYVESGAASGSRVPDAREHSATLALSLPFSPKVTASANGSWALARADAGAGEIGPIPETDRTQYGGQFALSETLGRLILVERVSWMELEDDVSPDNDVTTKSAQLTANGIVVPSLALASSLALTRTEAPLAGQNDSTVFAFQPTWTIAPIRVTLAPRASYTRNHSSVSGRSPRAEQYQALAYWSPLKVGRFEAILGGSVDWSRALSGAPGPQPPFARRYIGTFTIRWGGGTSGAASAMTPPAALEFRPFRPTPAMLAAAALQSP